MQHLIVCGVNNVFIKNISCESVYLCVNVFLVPDFVLCQTDKGDVAKS